MSTKRILRTIGLAGAIALLGAAGQSTAAQLTGNVSSSGASCLWLDEASAVGTTCPTIDISTATYFDFIVTTAGSPGSPGAIIFNTGSSDFSEILFQYVSPIGPVGTINDFSFATTGDITDFVLWSVVGRDSKTYQYTLQNITGVDRDTGKSTLGVFGLGQLCIVGDSSSCNTFDMKLTTQVTGGAITTTFSLSQAAVPEPGTLALIGLGLAGLGLAGRRRSK